MKPVVVEGVGVVEWAVEEPVVVLERAMAKSMVVEPEVAVVPQAVVPVKLVAGPQMQTAPGQSVARGQAERRCHNESGSENAKQGPRRHRTFLLSPEYCGRPCLLI